MAVLLNYQEFAEVSRDFNQNPPGIQPFSISSSEKRWGRAEKKV
jgi:hypothetical protein